MSENRFVDNGDGTVKDTLTQLMWMQKDSYLDLLRFVTHSGAVKYMNKKNEEGFASYTDWRLPNKREAPSLFDADKEGILRSVRSLVQTSGRASRNANGLVIMYADRVTASMQITLDLNEKRRKKKEAYNKKHGIVPKTIFRKIAPSFAPVEMNDMLESDSYTAEETPVYESVISMEEKIAEFEEEMREAAESLEFERAAELRDRIAELRKKIAG